MGYDLQFIQVSVSSDVSFPIGMNNVLKTPADSKKFKDIDAVKSALMEIEGTRPGPGGAIDYVGRGLNYARFKIQNDSIHVENNCGAGELLKIYNHLTEKFPTLLILDLQSGQLHNTASYEQWWLKPL